MLAESVYPVVHSLLNVTQRHVCSGVLVGGRRHWLSAGCEEEREGSRRASIGDGESCSPSASSSSGSFRESTNRVGRNREL